jgi:hypothetical protein
MVIGDYIGYQLHLFQKQKPMDEKIFISMAEQNQEAQDVSI